MAKPKIREQRLDQAPTYAFFAVTAIGIAYIILAKSFGIESLLVTIVPVALMAGYAILIPLAPALRLRNDQTADNFYYMGFIFTLVSLGVSLIQYSSGGGIDGIIRNFGIAIASTIAGITLRIVFNMMRRDPGEIEHTSRLELADAARKVRREMDSVLYEVTHFRRTNQQMVQEMFDEVRAQITAMGESSSAAIREVSSTANGGVETTVKEMVEQFSSPQLRQQLDRSSKSIERINGRLETAAESLTSAAESFSTRLSLIQTPDQVVEIKMDPVVDALQRTIGEATERLASQTADLTSLRQDLALLAQSMKTVSGDLGSAARALGEISNQLQQDRRPGLFGFMRPRGRDDIMSPDREPAP
jgi:hypothetical protein